MYDPLGLSIGTMNLVASANGSSPVIRRAVLTLYPHCAPKLGAFGENSSSAEPGALMSAFVERIGDSVALISPDGSAHDPDLLTVEALDAMVVAVDADASSSEIAIAIPAHWKPATVQALRNALRTHVGFVRSGMAPRLVSDAIAALTAVTDETEVPTGGTVGLVDFGASGTGVTLLDTKGEIEPVSATMRYEELSGNQIDQAILLHVLEELGHEDMDSLGTTALGQLGRLSEQCREAKERLSTDAFTELAVELSGSSAGIELTREKFEDLISDRLTGFIYAFDDMLARNKSSFADLTAVVAVGGGASIPLVTQRLSFHTRLPILSASQPVSAAARGALLLAGRGELLDMRTRTSVGVLAGAADSADVSGGASGSLVVLDRPPRDLLSIDQDALTDRELAWSQTEFPEILTRAAVAESYHDDGMCFSMRLNVIDPPKEAPWRRIRVSQVLIGLCAAVAMTAIGGVAITLTAVEQRQAPHHAPVVPSVAPTSPVAKLPSAIPPSPVAPSPLPPPPSEAPPSAAAPTSVEPPPPSPPPSPAPPAPSAPPTLATTTHAPPATTTRAPAATTPTTTAPPADSPAADAAPPEPPTDPSSVKMTTQWVKVPLIPIPIPIQVPQNQVPQNQVPQNQAPQNQFPQNRVPTNTGPQNPFQNPGSP